MSKQKKINLALQGGGSHGAFTWGVLDYLLEDGRFDFEAITATSAGSMNAVNLLYGLHHGGAEKARECLELFWKKISEAGALFNPLPKSPLESAQELNPFFNYWGFKNPSSSSSFNFFEALARSSSPYQFNPYDLNPLRDILDELIDFKELQKCKEGKLFITATNVRSGEARIFANHEITLKVVMASACLPTVFQAVEIEDEAYWDGGYMGNPSLWPLFYESTTPDLLLIHVNPIVRRDIPKDAASIQNRLNEITFNSSLLKELRAIQFVQKLLDEKMLKDEYHKKYKKINLHAIRAEETMQDLSMASKFDTSWPFLTHLRNMGREMAQEWVKGNYDEIGKQSTVDIQSDYLTPKCATSQKIKRKKSTS